MKNKRSLYSSNSKTNVSLFLVLAVIVFFSGESFAQENKINQNITNNQELGSDPALDYTKLIKWSEIKVRYNSYISGLKIANVEMTLTIDQDSPTNDVRMKVDAKTEPYVAFLSGGRLNLDMSADWFGRISNDKILANQYLLLANFGRNGTVDGRLLFDDQGIIDSWYYKNTRAPDRSGYKNYVFVTYDKVQQSIDPINAMTEFFLKGTFNDQPCSYTNKIFTGDHINSIFAEFVKTTYVKKSRQTGYEGEGIICTWRSEPFAGYHINDQEKRIDPEKPTPRKYNIDLTFSKPTDEFPLLLIKGVIETKYVTIHLAAESYSIKIGDRVISSSVE